MKYSLLTCLSLTLASLSVNSARAEITIACGRAELLLSEEAVPRSLMLLADQTECLDRTKQEPFAEIQLADGAWHAANRASKSGDTLKLGFRDADTTLSLAIESRPDWIALRVAGFGGPRPLAVRFAMLDSAFSQNVGKRLNIGWDPAHALCVMATSSRADTQVMGPTQVSLKDTVAAVSRGEGGVLPRVRLTAMAQDTAASKMEGAAAAIIACPTPVFKRVARDVAHAYGLLTNEAADGTPVKDTEPARASCLFVSAGFADADRIIRLCSEAGVRQVVLNSDAWCSSAKPCVINPAYFPKGVDDLCAFVSRLKAAGLTAGLQCPVSATLATGERAAQLADIYNACGFGMVCFDGAEDADGSGSAIGTFQADAVGRMRRPVLYTGTAMTHRLWSAFARSSAAGTYLSTVSAAIAAGQPTGKWPTVKQYVDASVARMLSLRGEMLPGELGRLGFWPRQSRNGREVEGVQLDEVEYLLCRSVAYDCPVSLQTSFGELDNHPLAPEILRLVKAYETARLARRFSEAECAPMREPGKEFTLLQRRVNEPVLVPVRPVTVGKSGDTHAMVGTFEKGAVATFWSASGSAHVTLDLSPAVARVSDFDDQRVVALKNADGKLVLPVTNRRLTLLCPRLDAATLEQKIRAAVVAK